MEILWQLRDNSGNPITGAEAETSLIIRRAKDGYLMDWDDLTFKDADWETLETQFAEIDAVNLPGAYKKEVDPNGWQIGWYHAFAKYAGTPIVWGEAEICTGAAYLFSLVWRLINDADQPITGSEADTSLKIRREADGFLLDWDDMTFKASGWTTLEAALDEIDADNLPGVYGYGLNVSPWDDGTYQVFAEYTETPRRSGQGELYLVDGHVIPAEIMDKVYIHVPGEHYTVEAAVEPTPEVEVSVIPCEITVEVD